MLDVNGSPPAPTCSQAPTGATTYGYNPSGDLTTAAVGGSGAASVAFGYDEANRLTGLAADTGANFTPINPTRIADTRAGSGEPYAGDTIGAGATLNVQVTGANGDKVPANATAVVLSLTAATATTATYLTVYPAGSTLPNTSALNVAAANQVTDNQVTAKVGNDGQVAVYNAHGSTNVVVDIMGYYTPVPSGSAGYNPVNPQRITDTRAGSGYPNAGNHLTAGSTDVVQVTGAGSGVPAGASAAVVDITALNDTPASYLVAYADGTTMPGTASLTYGNNVVTTKEATVALGADGAFDVTNGQANADITVDLEGYYMAGSGSQYTPAGPTRIADTRTGSGEPYAGQTIGSNTTLNVQVTGANGDGVPTNATAVVLNVTEVNATAGGYFTVYPAGTTQPTTTTVAFPAGSNVGDEVTVKLPASGAVSIYNLQGNTDAVVDVEGYFAPGTSQVAASYAYSGDNLRMSKTVNGTTQTMIWDTNETVPLLLSDTNNYYIYGPDNQPLEQINATNGTITWFQHDRQGSTRILLNNAGASIGTATYSPYGLAATTGTTSPLGYDGQYTDPETGLIYLQNRYYDPATAQYLTRDPADALTRSAYGYVDGNPLNRTDPSGLWNYYKNYNLGPSVMSPSEMMAFVAANFGALFTVPGRGATLYQGERMNLSELSLPFDVEVTKMTSTGWTFDTRFPHPDLPGFISFNFTQSSDCDLHLDVHGNVNGAGWLADLYISPLLHALYLHEAHVLWGGFANNLRTVVQLADQEVV